jgi:Zn finger protein HypA/HybF involved in hydrogenase expression
MTYTSKRCADCDALLWSNHAKECGLCPECENVDTDIIQDLEERFEEAYK